MSRRRHKVKAAAARKRPRYRLVSDVLADSSIEQLRAKLTELENIEMHGTRALTPDERADLRGLRQIPGVRRTYSPIAFKAIADAKTKRARRGLKVLELRSRGGLPSLDRPPAPADPAPDPTTPEAA
jgi:hypothetical protein